MTRAPSDSHAAERQRLRRKRQRNGERLVRISLFDDEIDGLVKIGQLREDRRDDNEALTTAAGDFLSFAIRDELKMPGRRRRKCHA